MSRRVYLAGALGRRAYLRDIAGQLRACGFEVTSRWLDEDLPPDAEGEHELSVALAVRDLRDIDASDIFVMFAEPPGSPLEARVGHREEFGYALCRLVKGDTHNFSRLRVIVVGAHRSVFSHLAEHYGNWPEARNALTAGIGVAK